MEMCRKRRYKAPVCNIVSSELEKFNKQCDNRVQQLCESRYRMLRTSCNDGMIGRSHPKVLPSKDRETHLSQRDLYVEQCERRWETWNTIPCDKLVPYVLSQYLAAFAVHQDLGSRIKRDLCRYISGTTRRTYHSAPMHTCYYMAASRKLSYDAPKAGRRCLTMVVSSAIITGQSAENDRGREKERGRTKQERGSREKQERV